MSNHVKVQKGRAMIMWKPYLLPIVVAALCVCCGVDTSAQVSIGGTPLGFSKSFSDNMQTVQVQAADEQTLTAQDEEDAQFGLPFRFGYAINVNFTLENSGTWENLPDGGRLWRLKITSPGAHSINLNYDDFHIPAGSRLFVYSHDRSVVIGAFTSANNKDHREFATTPIRGDICIVEYYEPAEARDQGSIAISQIVHGYRNVFGRELEKDFGESGSCHININCDEGAFWQDDKRSVAMILVDQNTRICSGTLVNNVRQDFVPYFLTAAHCTKGAFDPDSETSLFIFNYESPQCTPSSDGSLSKSIQGSTLKAINFNSDFVLLELNEVPPDDYDVYYAGWSAIDEGAVGCVGIHHPAGDVMKISRNDDLLITDCFLLCERDSHWRVDGWEAGATEGGSSGSPAFDMNHRIIGQLSGGDASCFDPQMPDYYGKFARSWDFGASDSERLKDWLDPDNTGTLVLDGIDPVDRDLDGIPDSTDNCVFEPNPMQDDTDGDNVGDACDNCPNIANSTQEDVDLDEFGNVCDNCPNVANPSQTDENSNGVGDACDMACCVDRGDVNDDSFFPNMADLIYLVNYAFKSGSAPPCLGQADVNGDGTVASADIVYLSNHMFRSGPAPVACP